MGSPNPNVKGGEQVKYIIIEPQPVARLLPYKDPVNGLFWAPAGEPPYDAMVNSPEWAHACAKPMELTSAQIESVHPELSDIWYCYGPGCATGPDGCNAMGCYGVRQRFSRILFDKWIWIDEELAEVKQSK